jgi:CO/xanthine dehydrogenase FAD-binding subunit
VSYRWARSLAEIEAVLASGEAPLVVAGGTDVMVRDRSAITTRAVLDVARVAELRRIALEDDTLVLGAAVTYAECLADPVIRRACPLLGRVAERFASPQIRNVATLGGNVANASPAGDGLVALWALDTVVEAVTPTGWVRRPIQELVVAPGRLDLPGSGVLTILRVPAAVPGEGTAFYKLVNRAWPEHPMAISVASVAARLRLDPGGRLGLVRVVLGAVAPTPVRAAAAEALLGGQVPTPARVAAAAAAAQAAAQPITDVRATAGYRREVLPGLVTAALEAAGEAARRARGLGGAG